jgi:hypothetical protein
LSSPSLDLKEKKRKLHKRNAELKARFYYKGSNEWPASCGVGIFILNCAAESK